MATFQVQVEDMVGTVGGDSSDTTALASFLTDGAKDVINHMPLSLLRLCSAEVSFTPQSVGSESSASTLNTAKVYNIRRNDGTIDQQCRLIRTSLKGRASDSDDMEYATVTDPVYYIESNFLNILPSSSSAVGKYSEVQYPAVAYGDNDISTFPDELESLVVLYAAMKGMERIITDIIGTDEDIELGQARKDQYTWLLNQYNSGLQNMMGVPIGGGGGGGAAARAVR